MQIISLLYLISRILLNKELTVFFKTIVLIKDYLLGKIKKPRSYSKFPFLFNN